MINPHLSPIPLMSCHSRLFSMHLTQSYKKNNRIALWISFFFFLNYIILHYPQLAFFIWSCKSSVHNSTLEGCGGGGEPPNHQAILQRQLGVLQFNSIWRNLPGDSIRPPTWGLSPLGLTLNPLQMPITTLLSTNQLETGDSNNPLLLGFNWSDSALHRTRRNILFTRVPVSYGRIYGSGTARQKKGSASVFTNGKLSKPHPSGGVLWRLHYIGMTEESPLVIDSMSSPSLHPTCREEGLEVQPL